jgi:uncharacterized protein (DUF1778 family)
MERDLIERETVIWLSREDVRMVLSLIDNPPEPNERLKDAVKACGSTVRA